MIKALRARWLLRKRPRAEVGKIGTVLTIEGRRVVVEHIAYTRTLDGMTFEITGRDMTAYVERHWIGKADIR